MRTTLDKAIGMVKEHHPTLESWKLVEVADLVQYGCPLEETEIPKRYTVFSGEDDTLEEYEEFDLYEEARRYAEQKGWAVYDNLLSKVVWEG